MCAVALLGATVTIAHSTVADDHMGEAAAMCLAIVVGGAAVAALPALSDRAPSWRAALELGGLSTPLQLKRSPPHLPRSGRPPGVPALTGRRFRLISQFDRNANRKDENDP